MRCKKGLTLIEVAMALAIVTLSFMFLTRLMADSSASAQAAADAKKMNLMARAAQSYLDVEGADLKAFITSATQIVAIPLARSSEGELPPDGPHATLPSVQKAGLLAAEFIDNNALGQRHVLLVKEPVADRLEGLVVAYGGSDLPDSQLGKVVQSLGMAGGAVFAKDVAPATATPVANANITGYAGGWTLPVNGWTGAALGGTPVGPSAGRPIVSINMMDVLDSANSSNEEKVSPTDRSAKIDRQYGLSFPPPAQLGYPNWPEVIYCPQVPSNGVPASNRILKLEFRGMTEVFSTSYYEMGYEALPATGSQPILVRFRFNHPSSASNTYGFHGSALMGTGTPNCVLGTRTGTTWSVPNASMSQLCSAGLCDF